MKKEKLLISMVMLIFTIITITKITFATEEKAVTINSIEISEQSKIPGIEITHKMNNGTEKENQEIETIINITEAGTYELSGTLNDGQISINANKVNGKIKILLNNFNITCEKAPAIFIYSNNIGNNKCEVTIETANNSENTIQGSKIKTNVEDWENQEKIEYYVEKGTDDSGEYYERYKYDGAISSDISLTFEGKGVLNVDGLNKEGIETKGDLTFNSGTIIINSQDDSINACTDGKSKITINDGFIIANVSSKAEEGDGIDSNGTLYINGGTVYAFACPGSDNGLDSDEGTYINGGTIISTGDMYEKSQTTNNTKIIEMQFSKKTNPNTNIAIVDDKDAVIHAFKANRQISTFTFASENLENDKEYNVYTNVEISGETDEYGVYTKISEYDLENAEKQENSNSMNMMNRPEKPNEKIQTEKTEEKKDYTKIAIILIVIVLIIAIVILILDIKFKKQLNILNLAIGILLGIILTCSILLILEKDTSEGIEQESINNLEQREPPERTNEPLQKNK